MLLTRGGKQKGTEISSAEHAVYSSRLCRPLIRRASGQQTTKSGCLLVDALLHTPQSASSCTPYFFFVRPLRRVVIHFVAEKMQTPQDLIDLKDSSLHLITAQRILNLARERERERELVFCGFLLRCHYVRPATAGDASPPRGAVS